MQSELPDYYRTLSLALYQVLEDIGANLEVRNLWKETFTTIEIIQTIAFQPRTSIYYFGSSREGTTTVDMNPDIDKVDVHNRFPIITDCSDIPSEICLLMVNDNTHPGYCKLQLVSSGIPLFQNDNGLPHPMIFSRQGQTLEQGRETHGPARIYSGNIGQYGTERHGPAICYGGNIGYMTVDFVYAFSVTQLPDCVEEWTSRTRHYNWPPVDVIDYCKTLGCLFVPVGHPHSDEQHLEWRLSLSHQERLLVSQFSLVQHKCYILLKLWKKDVLPSWIGQESLSSYHCKTCMFYMIENTPGDFWRPENLLGCFVACLKLFLFWTTNGICPNYFIPAENMFDRRIDGKLQNNLQQTLQNMLTENCKYLMQIHTCHIGDRLGSYVTMPPSNRHLFSQNTSYLRTKGILLSRILPACHTSRHIYMERCLSTRSQRCLKIIYNFSQHLKHTNTITQHTVEETQRAISCLLPFLELHLMTNMISLAKQRGRSREDIWRFLSSDSWHQLSLRSDISVKLKQASLMYMFQYYHASLDILSAVELRGVYSFCFCYWNIEEMAAPTLEDLISANVYRPNVTVEHMLNCLFVPCIVFLPAERNVIPDALCYEMLRYVVDPGHTDDLNYNYLRECAVIDGLFLFYFLLYLNHSRLSMRSQVRADIDNMNYTINARDSDGYAKCVHKEACLNILGWVYKDQGCTETAVECFRRSLRMKPRGNAAVWHIRDLQNGTH